MKTLVSINCAGPEKLPTLWATLTSLLTCGLPKGSVVRVNYNSDKLQALSEPNDGHGWDTLCRLFYVNGYKLKLAVLPELSVAQMYADALTEALAKDFEAILKIDDDCFVQSLDTAFVLAKEGHPYVSINFWDINNTRGYDDWRETVDDGELQDMIDKYGERTVWCHRWIAGVGVYKFRYSEETDVNASLFLLRTDKVPASLVYELRKLGKGVRGMDKVVGDAYRHVGRIHAMSSCAWHMGVHRPQLDGKYWRSFNEGAKILHANPTLNKDNGRGLKLFVGREVEQTPFFGQQTLFVQGLVDVDHVTGFLKAANMDIRSVEHVYLGAGGLSQLDTAIIPELLKLNVNVTVEAVVFPDEAQNILLSDRVVLLIPVTNEGRYQDQAIKAIMAWYKNKDFKHDDQVFFKIDTDEPNVLVFSHKDSRGLTVPSDYQGDMDIPMKSSTEWLLDRESWID